MSRTKKINLMLHIVFFINGCFYAANQLLINHITDALEVSGTQMAMMVGALYAGPMLMVLFFGAFSDKVGRKKSGAIAIICMSLGALLVAVMPTAILITVGFLLYGIGVGGMESVMFAVTADENHEKAGQHLIFNQALFSIGAMLTPVVISRVLGDYAYRSVYILMAIVWFGVCISVLYMPLTKAIVDRSKHISIGAMLKSPYLWFFMIAIIISTGSESAFTYWSGVFFKSIGAAALGATALSTYWFASIIGRLASSKVKYVEKLTFPCFLLASIGTGIFVGVGNPYLKLAGMLLVGVAFAPLYPALGYQSSQLFPHQKGAAFAMITFSSNLGGVITQPLISKVSEKSAISSIYIVICILCGVLALLTMLVSHVINKKRNHGGDNNVEEKEIY